MLTPWLSESELVAAQNIEALFRAYRQMHGGIVLVSPIDIVFSELDVGRYHVPEYWLVDPRERRCEVYWLSGDSYALEQVASDKDAVRSRILPDLAFPASEIFGDW